jgi:hypothetical protein
MQVVQQLTNPPGPRPAPRPQATVGHATANQATGGDATGNQGTADQGTADKNTVASLEQKLASAASRQRNLTAENARLREQLREAQQSLAEAQERASAEAAGERFGAAEVRLLERLLGPPRDQGGHEEAGAG